MPHTIKMLLPEKATKIEALQALDRAYQGRLISEPLYFGAREKLIAGQVGWHMLRQAIIQTTT